jgi:hypothetical protein
MISFESISSNNLFKYALYALAALVAGWVAYELYIRYFSIPLNNLLSGVSLSSLNSPVISGQSEAAADMIDDKDFEYIHGTTYKVDGLSPDPSNSVQKYKKTQDATGRSFWEPIQMTTTSDFLTNDEYENIVDRHVNRNMAPNLKYLTQPKYIRNADNFFGTYQPTDNTLDKCLDVHDVQNEGGLLGSVQWGQ